MSRPSSTNRIGCTASAGSRSPIRASAAMKSPTVSGSSASETVKIESSSFLRVTLPMIAPSLAPGRCRTPAFGAGPQLRERQDPQQESRAGHEWSGCAEHEPRRPGLGLAPHPFGSTRCQVHSQLVADALAVLPGRRREAGQQVVLVALAKGQSVDGERPFQPRDQGKVSMRMSRVDDAVGPPQRAASRTRNPTALMTLATSSENGSPSRSTPLRRGERSSLCRLRSHLARN